MRPKENIKKIFKKLHFSASAKLDEKIYDEISRAVAETENNKSAQYELNIWRIIMDSIKIRKVKVAIAVIVLMLLSGLIPFNGTTALGKIVNEITTTLTRLKAAISGEALSEAEHVERQIDKSVKICTTSRVYSSSEISSLEAFLNEQDIYFISAGSGNAKYAVIPTDKFADLRKFLRSSSINMMSCPKVLTYAGQEAMLFIPNTMGVAVTILQDGGEHFNLDFAFHNVEDGCEVNGIKLANGEALLISGIKSSKDETSDDLMTIIVLPEVKQE